jgi:hypothetical protein
VPAVLASATGSDWNAGGSLLTFYFPIALLVVIAALLLLQLGRPHKIPGHRNLAPSPARPAAGRSAAETTTTDATGQGDEAGNPASPPAEGTE